MNSKPIISETTNLYINDNNEFLNIHFNRLDLKFKNVKHFRIEHDGKITYTQVARVGFRIYIGLYLTNISKCALHYFIKFIFNKYKFSLKLIFFHCPTEIKKIKPSTHYHIDLRTTDLLFYNNLSQKTKYNTKWYPKKIIEDFGSYEIKSYNENQISNELIDLYFHLKRLHIPDAYKEITPSDYIRKYHITEFHMLTINNQPASILLLSSLNRIDYYLENITYSPFFSKYSPGNVLYYATILDLISRKARTLYLLGGDHDYKKRFNGTETLTYTGKISRFN